MGHKLQGRLVHVMDVWLGRNLDHIYLVRVPNITPTDAHLNWVIASADNQIRLANEGQKDVVVTGRQSGPPKTQRMIFWQDTFRLVRGDNRHVLAFAKTLDGRACIVF